MTDVPPAAPRTPLRGVLLPAALLGGLVLALAAGAGGPVAGGAGRAALFAPAAWGGAGPRLDVRALRRAAEAACPVTGCDAGALPGTVAAAARAMTEEELVAALVAQDRLLREGARVREAAAPGSTARRAATLGAAVVARTAQVYRAALRARHVPSP